MTHLLTSIGLRLCPTPRRLRTASPITTSPIAVAPLALMLVLAAGTVAPSLSAAEDEATAPAGSRSAGTAMRFTKDGPKEIVLTPEQIARQAARKAKRKERHAAEKAAAASKASAQAVAEPAKDAAPDAAGKPTAVPEKGREGAAKVGQ